MQNDPRDPDADDPRSKQLRGGVEQADVGPPTPPSPDGVEEQSAVETFDEEGAGIAAKE